MSEMFGLPNKYCRNSFMFLIFFSYRVRATDRHCRKMRKNNKFGAKNINLATTVGERKIASKFFCLASESSPPANKSLPRAT